MGNAGQVLVSEEYNGYIKSCFLNSYTGCLGVVLHSDQVYLQVRIVERSFKLCFLFLKLDGRNLTMFDFYITFLVDTGGLNFKFWLSFCIFYGAFCCLAPKKKILLSLWLQISFIFLWSRGRGFPHSNLAYSWNGTNNFPCSKGANI